jgi:hypothetical protein
MANMIPISTVTVGSGSTTSIDFNNIPQIYTDLLIKMSVQGTRVNNFDDLLIRFNGLTSGYSNRYLYGGNGSANSATAYGNFVGSPTASNLTNIFFSGEVYIPNYTGSNTKSYSVDSVNERNATEAYGYFVGGNNTMTGTINSISFVFATGPGFSQYSSFTLYGIRKY